MPDIDELKIERLARDLCEEDGKIWSDVLPMANAEDVAPASVGLSGRQRYRKLAKAALTAKRRDNGNGNGNRGVHCA